MTEVLLLLLAIALALACGAFVAAEFSLTTVERSTLEEAATAASAKPQALSRPYGTSPSSSPAPSWASP